jgi:Putative zinc-finger
MNHEQAIESKAAAGYLLDELPPAERDAFEEHYFDCRVCAEHVRSGVAMFATGREVVRSSPAYQRFRPLKWVAATAASTAFVVVAGYQGLVIPAVRMATSVGAVTAGRLIAGTTRASESDDYNIRFVRSRPHVAFVDIAHDLAPNYRLELRDAEGEVIVEDEVTAEEASNDSGVAFLIRPLPAGRYVFTVEGVPDGGGNRIPIAKRNVVVE